MFFSLLLCAFETHVRLLTAPIALNFGFLYNPGGRVGFMLLVGFMALAAGNVWAQLTAACDFVTAGVNAVMCARRHARLLSLSVGGDEAADES